MKVGKTTKRISYNMETTQLHKFWFGVPTFKSDNNWTFKSYLYITPVGIEALFHTFWSRTSVNISVMVKLNQLQQCEHIVKKLKNVNISRFIYMGKVTYIL